MGKQNIDKKDIAKSLYLNGNFTQEEIADKVGTTRQTVSRWIKDGGWEQLKASITITPAQILAGLNRQIIEINNNINDREEGKRFATVTEADTLAKLASAIKKIEQDVGIADMRTLTHIMKSCVHAADTAIDVGKHSIHHVFLQCGFGQEKVSERSRFRGVLPVEGVVVGEKFLLVRHIVGLSLMSSQDFMI